MKQWAMTQELLESLGIVLYTQKRRVFMTVEILVNKSVQRGAIRASLGTGTGKGAE